MSVTVPGIYKQGTITLLETPAGVREGEVLVTLQPAHEPQKASGRLTRGKYKSGRLSTEEDFKIAEWRDQRAFTLESRR